MAFDALAELGLFGLDEVADVGFFADVAAGAKVSEGADLCAVGDDAVVKHAALADQNAVAEGAVFDHRVGADEAVGADARAAEQLHKGLDDGVGRDLDIGVDHAGLGTEDGDAGGHQPAGRGGAQGGVEGDQLGDSVGAEQFDGISAAWMATTRSPAARSRPAMSVRIEFAVSVVDGEVDRDGQEAARCESVDARVDLAECQLVGGQGISAR